MELKHGQILFLSSRQEKQARQWTSRRRPGEQQWHRTRVHTYLMDVFGMLFQFKLIPSLFWAKAHLLFTVQANARQRRPNEDVYLLIVHGTLRTIQAFTTPPPPFFRLQREMQFFSFATSRGKQHHSASFCNSPNKFSPIRGYNNETIYFRCTFLRNINGIPEIVLAKYRIEYSEEESSPVLATGQYRPNTCEIACQVIKWNYCNFANRTNNRQRNRQW